MCNKPKIEESERGGVREWLGGRDAFHPRRPESNNNIPGIYLTKCRDAGNFSPPMSDAKLLGNAMCLAHVVTFILVRNKSGTSVIWTLWSILIARYES